MIKRVNGILTPQNMRDAFGSWIVHSACLTWGLCKRTGKTDTMRFIEPDVAYPMWGGNGHTVEEAKRQRFRYYKRHIKEVHGGNWDLKQGVPPMVKT